MLKTASVNGGSGSGNLAVQNNGTLVATQPAINFIAGSFITLTITNDATNQRSNVTINGITSNIGTQPYAYPWFLV